MKLPITLRAAVAVLPAAALLAGCGGGTTEFDTKSMSKLDSAAADLGGPAGVAAMKDLYQKAADGGQHQVTVYGPVEQELKPVYDAFTKRFPGIKIVGVPAFGPALDQKVNSEQASGRHVGDLVHTGTSVIDYGAAGKLQRFEPVTAKGSGAQVADPNKMFYANQYGAIGYVINTKKMDKAQAPKSWAQMGDPKYKGKIVLADPSKPGALADGFSNMLYSGAIDRPTIERVAANSPMIVDSSELALQAVTTGQRAIAPGLGFANFNVAKKKGAPLDMVFPLQGPTPMTVTYYGLLKGAPKGDAAKLLYTWMFTPEAMRLLPEAGLWGTRKGSPGMPGYPGIDQIQVVKKPPFNESEKRFNETLGLMKQIFK